MITLFIGTKAQLVKMAPLIRELSIRNISYKFVLTGQHTETMSDLIDAFDIREPDDVLVAKGESDSKIKLMYWLVLAFKAVLKREYLKNDTRVLLVHGDTLSTLFGALVGRKYGIPVCHIEAGLRSYNYINPFPEEMIRVITSYLSDVHYCSSSWAVKNLKKFSKKSTIINTYENTIVDSLRYAISSAEKKHHDKKYCVFSMHRNENLSNAKRFELIMNILEKVAEYIQVRFIMHPVTKKKLCKTGWYEKFIDNKNIDLVDRMDYVSFAEVLVNSNFLITDGGSNQEEAYHMGLPCLLLRSKTERMEGLGRLAWPYCCCW